MKKIKFKSFSSGSCGNCYFVGMEEDGRTHGVLIDAGVSPRRLKRELQREGLGFDNLDAILITHDHLDHIRSLGSYCKHVQKPVYSTRKLLGSMSGHYVVGSYLSSLRRELSEGWNEVSEDISARYFIVPHDATQTVGYAMNIAGHKYVHITDCGRMTEEAMNWCSQADTLVLESNYDPQVLHDGPYPPDLQARISGGHGHLSNGECAAVLRAVNHEGLKQVFLCHLSEHNNTPELAMGSALAAFDEESGRPRVVPLPRETASPMYFLL